MKLFKKMLVIIGISYQVLTHSSYSTDEADINAFLQESPQVTIAAKAITNILIKLGLESSYQTIEQSPITVDSITTELSMQMPQEREAFKEFINKISRQKIIKRAYEEISTISREKFEKTKIFTNKQLIMLSYIITLYLINKVRSNLIDHYTQRQPLLSEEEINMLYSSCLEMCTCNEALLAKRFILILNCIEQLQQHVPTNHPIVITSLGSSTLLMEYLLVKTLKVAGYQAITLNAIDQVYRSIKNKGDDTLNYVNTFCKGTGLSSNVCIQNNSSKAGLNAINIFDSPYTYADACNKNPQLKSTIMLAVDPSMDGVSALFATPFKGSNKKELRAGINRVDIFFTSKFHEQFDITIYLPHFGSPRIYWDRLIFLNPQHQEKFTQHVEQIASAFPEPRQNHIQAYDAALLQEIIQAGVSALLEENQALIRERTEQKLHQQGKILSTDQREKIIQRRIEQSQRDKAKNIVTVEYKRDPYIILEDLAFDCLNSQGFGYMLGVNKLIFFDLELLRRTGSYSLYEQFGDNERRCILRSPEFIEQKLK